MSTTPPSSPPAGSPTDDTELKATHRAMWALGDYPAVASDVNASLGPILVEAAGIGAGQRVQDVAAGSGNVALPAARTGADVVATDLTPELLEAGRAAAEAAGLTITWAVGDAENLPSSDGEFDTVVSCIGVMFAPHHQAAADELVRIVRPGGTIGLLNWTPNGFIGQMIATMRPYAPPPPPGAQSPPLWGTVDHVRELFGDRVEITRADQENLVADMFATPQDFLDYLKANFGPTIAAYRFIGDDADRAAALDADLIALAERFNRGTQDGLVFDWEYLLLIAIRT